MRITVEKARKTIIEMEEGSYDPTAEDAEKMYQYFDHPNNKGQMAWILGHFYRWLSQEPEVISLNGGRLFASCEMGNYEDGLLCVHYCYLNEEMGMAVEDRIYDRWHEGPDIIDVPLKSLIRNRLRRIVLSELNSIAPLKKQGIR